MTQTTPSETPRPKRGRVPLGLVVGLVAVVGCLGVLYGMKGAGNSGATECRAAASSVARLDPLVHGEIAALNLRKEGRLAPDLAFKGPDGQTQRLSDYRGKTVLLNIWATWCVPCRKEMPALDRLQAQLGGPDFQVVPINVDTARLDQPKAFLDSTGVKHLPLLTDSEANAFQVLRERGEALGLPTTLVLDKNGCELGVMAGPAEWDSPEAQKLIQAAKTS